MTAEITLADAIAGLVAEKRALGYKYVSEERALARFEAFCASEFPGLETVTRASVEAWIAAARAAGGEARDREQPDRAGQRARPLASPPRRRRVRAAGRGACASPRVTSRTSTATGSSRRCSRQTDRCRYCPEVPFRHLVMPVLFRTIYACGLRCSEARLLRVKDVDIDSGRAADP